jgi:hypothetical protein
MTDAQMQEIYSLMRDAFRGGQKTVQVQSFPFRMTAENMARHRRDPHIAFWRNLKQGSDHFEVTRLEPKVDVCGKRYVFDAAGGAKFEPSAACPAYWVKPEIAAAVAAKVRKDEQDEQVLVAALEKGAPAGGVGPGTLFASAEKPAQIQAPKPDTARPVRTAAVAASGGLPGSQDSQASLFAAWTRSTAQPTQAAPSTSALVAPAAQAASESGGVKGFFNRILGREGRDAGAPAAGQATESADPAMPLPAPKPRRKSAVQQDASAL